MGVFWPVDSPSQLIRLVGLVGVVAGCCAVVDRDTRYRILRQLYAQLRRLDEAAAAEIEATAKATAAEKKQRAHLESLIQSSLSARDTHSFASDSTAFSRAVSPQNHVGGAYVPGHLEGTLELTTEPSSALCSSPESVSQLSEALSRLQRQTDGGVEAALCGPSPLSRAVRAESRGAEGNLDMQGEAVASNEMLLPLLTAGNENTPPVAKAVDASKRLAPLPNPSAPKIRPAVQDGRPQLFDYTPPADMAAVVVHRREREHVEIETTDHDSYGFVSNPSAMVPVGRAVPEQLAGSAGAMDGGGDHYLFVCVKCHRQSTNEVCEKICSDTDGVLRCKLRPGSGQLVEDMEDLVMPMTPKMYVDGRRKTTGRMLYENLQALHAQHERMKDRAACRGSGPHSHEGGGLGSRECPNAVRSRLRIVPVNCLSMCHLGNVIAVAGPGKFSYQFGAMNENDSEDMQSILQFAEDYIESQEGFTKNKNRPPRLSRNILARIPPPLPTFTSIAE
ncbi:hypothetical protein GGF46_000203 [Coemansia sp. RSA 552]|nr:hypothetical protein GGF46_000203 [Coemansia sp. RSA 552]